MKTCPECGAKARTLSTRECSDQVTRRKECERGHRFTTREQVIHETVTNGPGEAGMPLLRRGVLHSQPMPAPWDALKTYRRST